MLNSQRPTEASSRPLTPDRQEAVNDGEGLVEHWRVTQLTRLAIPGPLAQAGASHVGWHQIARLVQRGVLRG